MDYKEFLKNKEFVNKSYGINVPIESLNKKLFDFQRDIVYWCLQRGKSAVFADCGLGKTLIQLEWAHQIHQKENKPVLILTPIAVARQTQKEAIGMNILNTKICHDQSEVINGINITNYEKLHKFDLNIFIAVVLDESSILKSFTGKYRNDIVTGFKNTPYKLACTATPAPNDFMELGNHSEFLNILSQNEMLTTFFVHDGGDTSQWRLKGHAESKFWEWMGSWCVIMRKPSDLEYDDGAFTLPELRVHNIVVESGQTREGLLIPVAAATLQERQQERKASIDDRVQACADLINKSNDIWLVWCNLNEESDKLTKAINDAIEVKGSHSQDYKEKSMAGFSDSQMKVMVTKPSIAGFGMNWQHCHKMAFVGLSDSYEQYYQAMRRCWRFGQKHPVDVYIITAETEGAVVQNIEKKEQKAMEMAQGVIDKMHIINQQNIKNYKMIDNTYIEDIREHEPYYTLYNADCIEVTKNMPSDSIHFSIFSPPFADLYTYSNSDRDMGNCKSQGEFMEHFAFLVDQLYRITMPGRLCAFHCMNLPIAKQREGYIGIRDFRGMLIRLFEEKGWIYHSEVCIWKDPVIAMQRTKALGLLHKQIKKDSAMCRQGIADYLVIMRKHGDNPERIEHTNDSFPVKVWQRYASPVWAVVNEQNKPRKTLAGKFMDIIETKTDYNDDNFLELSQDINPSDTLQRTSVREEKDERHICPLQLPVIQRAINLWTNPHDIVFTPFMGIGSECYQAILMDRRTVGVELKKAYYDQAVANCDEAIKSVNEEMLFEL